MPRQRSASDGKMLYKTKITIETPLLFMTLTLYHAQNTMAVHGTMSLQQCQKQQQVAKVIWRRPHQIPQYKRQHFSTPPSSPLTRLQPNEWVSRGLTSHSTLNRSFRGRLLQARWPNQQCQSTEGSQLDTEIGFSPTRTTPLCYNMN